MPRAVWDIDAEDVDQFDRDSMYVPYSGPIPPTGGTGRVYHWVIKRLKYAAATADKNPQLRIGLELSPRPGYKENQFSGYFIMAFIPITNKTQFRYVPFLDALGVSGNEFKTRTITDEEGNIKKIGKWRNDGDFVIAGELKDGQDQNGKPRLEIGWMGEATEIEGEEDDYDDEDAEDDGWDED